MIMQYILSRNNVLKNWEKCDMLHKSLVFIPGSGIICRLCNEDFCRQAAWMSRRNAYAFQGSAAPYGGKKTVTEAVNDFAPWYSTEKEPTG